MADIGNSNDGAMVEIPLPDGDDNNLIVLEGNDYAEERGRNDTHEIFTEQTSFHENLETDNNKPKNTLYLVDNDDEGKDRDFLTERVDSAHEYLSREKINPTSFLDSDAIQHLDDEYEKALQEREIGWNARYAAVRQNAGLSLWFMACLLLFSNIYLGIYTDWSLRETLLFSIITITTVGYGYHTIPKEDGVLLFICVYIFIGIAILTIMVAQIYQWIVLEVTRARYAKERRDFSKELAQDQHLTTVTSDDIETPYQEHLQTDFSSDFEIPEKSRVERFFDAFVGIVEVIQAYVKDAVLGNLIAVMVPFSFMILLGAVVVGSIEKWTFTQSLYFSVVSLTTVGYGDFVPTADATAWFCIFWLPFSIGFMSLYLGSVAQTYIQYSELKVKRIEKRLRRRINDLKEKEGIEHAEALARGTSGGFDLSQDSFEADVQGEIAANGVAQDPPTHIKEEKQHSKGGRRTANDGSNYMNTDEMGLGRRDEVLKSSGRSDVSELPSRGGETTRQVLDAIKEQMDNSNTVQDPLSLHSTHHYITSHGVEKKPSFALRVLVSERISQIIARDIAGYQSHVGIKENTLSVTIDSLKATSKKWVIPRRARKAFRAVAFEALYFVGERSLIIDGAEPLLELNPVELQGLYAPLLAAFGDANTMEIWLKRTELLSTYELQSEDPIEDEARKELKLNQIEGRRQAQLTQNLTANPDTTRKVIGNAFANPTNTGPTPKSSDKNIFDELPTKNDLGTFA